MKKSRLIVIIVLLKLIISCSKKESIKNVSTNKVSQSVEKSIDTIERNSYIVYSRKNDTLIQGKNRFEISFTTKNIDKKYIIQYFNYDKAKVIANYYPDKESSVVIKKNGIAFFNQTFYKSIFKKYFDMDVEKFIMHDIELANIPESNDTLSLKATLEAPNTDWVFDFLISVYPNGKTKISKIEYESE